MKYHLLLLAILTLGLSSFATAQEQPAKVVQGATQAADRLLGVLSEQEKDKLLFEFDNNDQRENWSNLPEGIVKRGGLRMGDLNQEQKDAVFQLLKAVMSDDGYQQIIDNMASDQLLVRDDSGRGEIRFGKDEYFISILGKPSTTEPWMIQFGGHHLAINATIVNDRITLSPSLTGGQPVNFELEGRKVRQLGPEEDQAFELVNALNEEQRSKAIVSDRPAKLIWGPGDTGAQPMDQGIAGKDLNESQQQLLVSLIEKRIGILKSEQAKPVMEKVKANIDETWFAWFGPTKPGQAASYRIQGPTLLIEYCPQDPGGDGFNHLHAMYRDPSNDYGVGFIRSQGK